MQELKQKLGEPLPNNLRDLFNKEREEEDTSDHDNWFEDRPQKEKRWPRPKRLRATGRRRTKAHA